MRVVPGEQALASDESRYVIGVRLPVDGGLHCGH